MWVEKSRTKSLERRTFIKGKFKGKFIGTLDEINSDLIHENFYDIEILDAEIFLNKNEIKHYVEGEHDEFTNIAPFITTLPYYIKCNIEENGLTKHYEIHLNDPKLRKLDKKDSLIEKVLIEDQTVFGDLVGEISGYILHYDTQITYYNVWVEPETPILGNIPEDNCIPTNLRTGKKEKSGNYVRYECHCQCFKKTYWGAWESLPEPPPFPWWIIGLIFLLFVFGPIVYRGLEIILPLIFLLLGIYLIGILFRVIIFLARFISYILSASYILFLIFGFISIFTQKRITPLPKKGDVRKSVVTRNDTITNDTFIISHLINWQDYKMNNYFGTMKVYAHEVANAGIFRNNFGNINNGADYEVLLRNLYGNQKNKLQLLYPMYDSIRQKNQLNKMEFAEVIVSSIQEIPYTLILNKSCDPSLYNDEFIQDYLNNEKGDCVGNVKYGIFSPSEFLEKLKGDCDTRTLLLFTILTHFGYDVAILSSDIYKHSIIGINLPYQGLFKKINGKRYVLWETTAVGMPPGLIPSQISNVRNWYPSLLNNN